MLGTSSIKTPSKQQELTTHSCAFREVTLQREEAKMHLSDLITSQISAIADATYQLACPKLPRKAASPYVKQTSKQKPGLPLTPEPLNNWTILKNGLE